MKKDFTIGVIIGTILGLISSNIKYNSSSSQIGSYYSIGFPFKTYEMLGDAGILNNFAIFENILFWIILIMIIIFLYKKIRK